MGTQPRCRLEWRPPWRRWKRCWAACRWTTPKCAGVAAGALKINAQSDGCSTSLPTCIAACSGHAHALTIRHTVARLGTAPMYIHCAGRQPAGGAGGDARQVQDHCRDAGHSRGVCQQGCAPSGGSSGPRLLSQWRGRCEDRPQHQRCTGKAPAGRCVRQQVHRVAPRDEVSAQLLQAEHRLSCRLCREAAEVPQHSGALTSCAQHSHTLRCSSQREGACCPQGGRLDAAARRATGALLCCTPDSKFHADAVLQAISVLHRHLSDCYCLSMCRLCTRIGI